MTAMPPPENSKLGDLLVAVKVTVSFRCLLRDLVFIPDAGGCCGFLADVVNVIGGARFIKLLCR
jgi:hypothetical protein